MLSIYMCNILMLFVACYGFVVYFVNILFANKTFIDFFMYVSPHLLQCSLIFSAFAQCAACCLEMLSVPPAVWRCPVCRLLFSDAQCAACCLVMLSVPPAVW